MNVNEVLFDNKMLINKLENCAKEIELKYPDEVFNIVIFGGAALMLINDTKTTNDIDVISVSNDKIWPILRHHSMNGRVTAYLDSYSSDMEDRYIHLNNIKNKNVNYFVCSLEDIVAAKSGAGREKDFKDIQNNHVYNAIDFDLLDKIIYQELCIDYFSETRYKTLLRTYEKYKNKELWQNENH